MAVNPVADFDRFPLMNADKAQTSIGATWQIFRRQIRGRFRVDPRVIRDCRQKTLLRLELDAAATPSTMERNFRRPGNSLHIGNYCLPGEPAASAPNTNVNNCYYTS